MDEFLLRAAAGGIAIAFAAGPIGTFMLWRRMAFFGAAIAEAAVLGVTLGLLIGLAPIAGAMILCLSLALVLQTLIDLGRVASDTVIGAVGHGALALAIVLLVYLGGVRVDLMGYLFGDILAVGWGAVGFAFGLGLLLNGALFALWRPLLSSTVEPAIAAAEGTRVNRLSLLYAVLLGIVIALGLKLVGALLIVALLIMPAGAARTIAKSPLQMAVIATLIGMADVVLGLGLSAVFDWPAGPAIALVGAVLFIASLITRH